MKQFRHCLTWLVFFIFSQAVFAVNAQQDPAPLAQLKQSSAQMLQMLHKNKSRIQHDKEFLEREVTRIVMPNLAVNNMSKAVVGRNAWNKATPEQKKAFKEEFTKLVFQVYAAPLTTFNDDQIKFYPIRSMKKNASTQNVHSLIIRKSGQRIPVNYSMIKVKDKWYVKDFSIEGISMVESYRSQFAETLSQDSFSGLIKQLKEHNEKNA